jgi:indolepyruvate ferredoxin oxidoreductase
VERLTRDLTAESFATAVAAAGASELVRGYEDVKLAGVERYRAALVDLGLQSDA